MQSCGTPWRLPGKKVSLTLLSSQWYHLPPLLRYAYGKPQNLGKCGNNILKSLYGVMAASRLVPVMDHKADQGPLVVKPTEFGVLAPKLRSNSSVLSLSQQDLGFSLSLAKTSLIIVIKFHPVEEEQRVLVPLAMEDDNFSEKFLEAGLQGGYRVRT